jgi:hypothetical protein
MVSLMTTSYDAKADKNVSVTAIYGLVKEKVCTNPITEAGGLYYMYYSLLTLRRKC